MNLPYMKFYVRDWISDPELRMASMAARGLWMECLCLMHQGRRRGYLETPSGRPIKGDDLARLTGTFKGELQGLMDELLGHGIPSVEEETGVWYSRRMVAEQAKAEKCSEAGRRGGGNPSLKEESDTRYQIPDTRYHISLKVPYKGANKGAKPYSEEFLEFWAVYPRKVNKGKAYQAWCKLNGSRPDAGELVSSVRAQCETEDWKRDGGRYIPHPSSWLNASGWDNDVSTMNARPSRPSRRSMEENIRVPVLNEEDNHGPE